MTSPKEQQIGICLLKYNLEDIENEITVQKSALPALDAENEKQYQEIMNALKVSRSLNAEIERLKLENVRLTAKRMQLKRQAEDVIAATQTAKSSHANLENLINLEEKEEEAEIRSYEDGLHEIADRFRKSRVFYNETQIGGEISKMNEIIAKLEIEVAEAEAVRENSKLQLDSLQPTIADNMLEVLGKTVLEDQLNTLNIKYEKLLEKRNILEKSCPKHVSG